MSKNKILILSPQKQWKLWKATLFTAEREGEMHVLRGTVAGIDSENEWWRLWRKCESTSADRIYEEFGKAYKKQEKFWEGAEEMKQRGWQFDMLTGETQNREQVIRHFNESADTQFFLISLKAGGVGLNLTSADYVFMLTPWWNRAAEGQAISRAHRIGQQRSVFVYNFVTKDTLEEQILTLQNRKQSLVDAVLPFLSK